MKPDKPPEEDLKPERIQDQDEAVEKSFVGHVFAVLKRIESVARGLRKLLS